MKKMLLLATLPLALSATASAQTMDSAGLHLGIFAPLAGPLLTAAGAAVVAALGYATNYLKIKTDAIKNEQFKHAVQTVEALAFTKVTELAKVSIDQLKAASADGTLTADEAKAVLKTALKEIWSSLPTGTQDQLSQAAGGNDAAVAQYIQPAVESAVKNTSTANNLLASVDTTAKRPSAADVQRARQRIGL